jgi:hypothetical protein
MEEKRNFPMHILRTGNNNNVNSSRRAYSIWKLLPGPIKQKKGPGVARDKTNESGIKS